MKSEDRPAAETRWLKLTRETLPAVARARRWPVEADHCFQRIFLDMACDGVWYDRIPGRPAYAYADRALLDRAIAFAEAALAGEVDIAVLNRRSLAWRKARRSEAQSQVRAPTTDCRAAYPTDMLPLEN